MPIGEQTKKDILAEIKSEMQENRKADYQLCDKIDILHDRVKNLESLIQKIVSIL